MSLKVCHVCILWYHLFLSFLFSKCYLEISDIRHSTFVCHISCLLPIQRVFWTLVLPFLLVFLLFILGDFLKIFFTSVVFSSAVSWATVLEPVLVWHNFMLISPNENYLWDQLVAELCPKPSWLPSGSILHKFAVSWSSTWLKSLLISPTRIFPS